MTKLNCWFILGRLESQTPQGQSESTGEQKCGILGVTAHIFTVVSNDDASTAGSPTGGLSLSGHTEETTPNGLNSRSSRAFIERPRKLMGRDEDLSR